MSEQASSGEKSRERGVSLFLIVLGLTFLLGIAGLGIDLATLYVARNEAQRAADAAALAGAQQFQSYVAEGLMTATAAETLATEQAVATGNQNLIIGQSPSLSTTNFNPAASSSNSCPPPSGVSGGCYNFSTTNDPRVTVRVYKNMPTYFMRIFGITSVPVEVSATAEAYVPEGDNGPPSTVTCLKPWLLPNCDTDHGAAPGSTNANPNCPCGSGQPCASYTDSSGVSHPSGGYAEYFVNPSEPYQVLNPGLTPTGAVGEELTIKPGDPNSNAVPAPSKFWPIFLPSNGSFTCPSCASSDMASGGTNSASLYRENIECCSQTQITCGLNTVTPITGDKTGPTGQGVDCLIHEGNGGGGQDTISLDTGSLAVPFIMYAGANNPYYPVGTQLTSSDSEVTLPLYDGQVLCPGNSCPSTVSVNVTGFLQLFIDREGSPQHSVYAYVLNVSSCNGATNSSGTGTGTPVPAVEGTPITIRLIHN